jgi:hypothetical protein
MTAQRNARPSSRECGKIGEARAPFHVVARGKPPVGRSRSPKVEAVQDGGISIELINGPFLFGLKATPDLVFSDYQQRIGLQTVYQPSIIDRSLPSPYLDWLSRRNC